eukprot:6139825-Heterocapsa_arctica.AAC.1
MGRKMPRYPSWTAWTQLKCAGWPSGRPAGVDWVNAAAGSQAAVLRVAGRISSGPAGRSRGGAGTPVRGEPNDAVA